MPSYDLTCGHMFFFKGAPQESGGSIHPCVRTGLEHLTHQLEVQGHGITMFEEHVAAPVIYMRINEPSFYPWGSSRLFFGLHRTGQGFQIVIGTSVLDLFMGSGPQWLCLWGVHWFSRTPFLSIWVWVKIGYTPKFDGS